MMMMSKEAEETMDNMTIEELINLNALGYICITGNGHLVAIVPNIEANCEMWEKRRCEHGY